MWRIGVHGSNIAPPSDYTLARNAVWLFEMNTPPGLTPDRRPSYEEYLAHERIKLQQQIARIMQGETAG